MQTRRVQRQRPPVPPWESHPAVPLLDFATDPARADGDAEQPMDGAERSADASSAGDAAQGPLGFGHSLGRISILPPRADGGAPPTQRAPDPAAQTAAPGDGASPAGTDSPVPLDATKPASGATTIQNPPTMQSTTIHGTTLAAVAAAIPDEAGSVEFDFSVATQGDPATSATLSVTQTMTLPRWAERDTASGAAQREWDRFLGALTQHENGHVAIDLQVFANAHQRFVGNTSAQVEKTSERLRAEVQAKQEAFDTQTDHGRTGNPPTTLDTAADADAGSAPKSTMADDHMPSAADAVAASDGEPPAVQARLVIGPTDDPYEREANAVADQVLRRDPTEQLPFWNAEHAPWPPPQVARAGVDNAPTPRDVPPVVEEALSTGGAPLGAEPRADMERRFGRDFSRVRIHADTHAAESARAINALAYTVGDRVAFGAGQYAPESDSGRWLLAHELTHVVQQRGETVAPFSPAGDRADRRIQRQEAPPSQSMSPQDQLKADFERAVDTSDWGQAAQLLDRFNDADLAAKAAWLAPNDRDAVREHTPAPLGRVRGALLVADFDAAVLASDWPKAAGSLNGLDDAGIVARIAPLPHAHRVELYVGAINAMTGVSRTRIIDPIAKADLDAALDGALRPAADWAKAIEYLNGFSDADLRARARKLQASERAAMLPVVPEWSHRVRGALLDAGFADALASGDLDAAARCINGLDDAGIKEHVAQVPEDQLEPLMQASDRVNGGNAMRTSGPIFDRMMRSAMTAGRWQSLARMIEGYLEHGGTDLTWLDGAPGQLQALLAAAQDGHYARAAQAISPILSQKLSDQQSTTLSYNMDVNAPPGQINLTQSRERQDPKYIDNAAYQVMVGIYLPGYFVYCTGQDQPIVIPWEYVNYSTTAVPSIDEVVYPNREAALAQIVATPSAPRGSYAYYQAAAGFHAPTIFSFATAPHIVGMLQDAVSRLQQEVQNELTVMALTLAAGAIVEFATTGLARSGAEAKAPAKEPVGAGGPNNGSGGAMRRYTYEPGPVNVGKPGLRTPSKEVGQEALDNSISIGPDLGKTRRVGINHETREFVDFEETENESRVFNGVTRRWEDLPQAARNELIGNGAVTREGKIVADLGGVERQARINNFRRTVTPEDLRGAPPAEGSTTPGHARSKHSKEGMTNDVQAEVVNAPDRIFSGINKNGREVDIYCKKVRIDTGGEAETTDVAVITEAGDKQSVITAYKESPSDWATDPSYVDIGTGGDKQIDIHYHTREDFEADFWPDWRARPTSSSPAPK